MLSCLSCSKQATEGEEEEVDRGGNKEGVKSLTSQLKDMALKLKPVATSTTTYKRDQRQYPPYPYTIPGSSSSTPAWDFPTTERQLGASSSSSARLTGSNRDENDGPKEWMAQVEPGVHITFMSLPNGGNDLKRIRFSREMFDKWQAQRWWGENYDRIVELYNVQKFNQQALETPARSEDERDSSFTRRDSVRDSSMMTPAWMPRQYYSKAGNGAYTSGYDGISAGYRGEKPSIDAASVATSYERDEPSVSMSNASEVESEWVEEDEPGVYITLRQLTDGTKELRRVRFSRERFGEVNAKLWWEQNRDRIQEQYL